MKKYFLVLLVLILISSKSNAQEIDNTNYYDFQVNYGSTNWLRISDIVPVIIDELKKNGVSYHQINVGELFKINDTIPLVATVAFRSGDKSYGFVYERSHKAELNVSDRDFLKTPNQRFTQIQNGVNGESKWIEVNPLPSNIFLLKQTIYWYQYGSNDKKFPVNRKVIEEVLRQDVRAYLKRI